MSPEHEKAAQELAKVVAKAISLDHRAAVTFGPLLDGEAIVTFEFNVYDNATAEMIHAAFVQLGKAVG